MALWKGGVGRSVDRPVSQSVIAIVVHRTYVGATESVVKVVLH